MSGIKCGSGLEFDACVLWFDFWSGLGFDAWSSLWSGLEFDAWSVLCDFWSGFDNYS